MYKTITQHEFAETMSENKDNGFTYDGACMLHEYLESFENLEFDMIAIRCDYSEYTLDEFIKENLSDYTDYIHDNDLANCRESEIDFADNCEEYMDNIIAVDTSKDIILIYNT